MALSQKHLVQFEKQLSAWSAELEQGVNHTIHALNREQAGSFPDPTDQASVETERDFDLRIHDRERKLIKKISQALGRIKDGDFGICDSCGTNIGIKRLQARPVTTLCIDCKTAQEHEERTLTD